jgi:hypothetical protein
MVLQKYTFTGTSTVQPPGQPTLNISGSFTVQTTNNSITAFALNGYPTVTATLNQPNTFVSTSFPFNSLTVQNFYPPPSTEEFYGWGYTEGFSYNYIESTSYSYIMRYVVTSFIDPIVCFKENTKILTNKGYEYIQDLRKGDLVKTVKHGYVPIHVIGVKEIYHEATQERTKDKLYKCSKNIYSDLFEDLVVTGCHSILVDEFIDAEQRQKTIDINGDTFVTDNKYRLPACADNRSIVYETSGNYKIYHFALDHEDYYMNYGVYANGLLVESCSKKNMDVLSNMEMIE